MTLIGETTPGIVPADFIKEGSDASFMADVVEASRTQPVIVDFWAIWSGGCRPLTAALEKAVTAAKGAVKLVKIDIDKNPVVAGQLRVISTPTVYAFSGGMPVGGFMGELPDSQIKAFMDKLLPQEGGAIAVGPVARDEHGTVPGLGLKEGDRILFGKWSGGQIKFEGEDLLVMKSGATLAIGKESTYLGDLDGAARAYERALHLGDEDLAAIGGTAGGYLAGDEHASEVADVAPSDAKPPGRDSVRAPVGRVDAAPADTPAAERRQAREANEHEAQLELSVAKLVRQLQAILEESGDPNGFDARAWVSSWLRERLPELGGLRPLALLDTMEGQALVSDAMARIQSGAYA